MPNERVFAVRTVRNGRVKIGGEYFYPDTELPSRFDGKRFAFGRYIGPSGYEPYINLWGTEKLFTDKTRSKDLYNRETNIITNQNNEFEWHFWRTKDELEKRLTCL